MKTFNEWHSQLLTEMAARRSFSRTLSKFASKIDSSKPVAVLTAFRADLAHPEGKPLDHQAKLVANRAANRRLEAEIMQQGMSFYPVIGAGQEEDKATGKVTSQTEESYIVQPIANMDEEQFVSRIRRLLFSEHDPAHRQWGAAIKLPSEPQAFLLHHAGDAHSPSDYNLKDKIGSTAKPRNAGNPYFTQMKKGPAAADSMMLGAEKDVKPKPRRRFTIGD